MDRSHLPIPEPETGLGSLSSKSLNLTYELYIKITILNFRGYEVYKKKKQLKNDYINDSK